MGRKKNQLQPCWLIMIRCWFLLQFRNNPKYRIYKIYQHTQSKCGSGLDFSQLNQLFHNRSRKTHLLQRWPKRWKWTVRAWVKPERQKPKVLQEQGKKQKERERVKIKSQKEVKRLLRRCSMPWPLSGGQQKIGSLVMILLMMRSRRKKDVDKTTQVLLDPGGLSRRGGLSNDVYNNYRSIQGLFLGVVIYAALEGRGQKEQTRFGQSYPWAWAFTVASCLETLWTIFLWLFQQTLEPRVKALGPESSRHQQHSSCAESQWCKYLSKLSKRMAFSLKGFASGEKVVGTKWVPEF